MAERSSPVTVPALATQPAFGLARLRKLACSTGLILAVLLSGCVPQDDDTPLPYGYTGAFAPPADYMTPDEGFEGSAPYAEYPGEYYPYAYDDGYFSSVLVGGGFGLFGGFGGWGWGGPWDTWRTRWGGPWGGDRWGRFGVAGWRRGGGFRGGHGRGGGFHGGGGHGGGGGGHGGR